MDDRTKGVNPDRTSGRGDEYISGRGEERSTGRAPEAGMYPSEERIGTTAPRTGAQSTPSAGATEAAQSDTRTRQIRAEIEKTRGDMSETIDAIQDRLKPSTIASNAASTVKEAASSRAREVADSEMVQDLRANPVPTAMIGIGLVGLAWLAFGGRDASDYRYRSRARSRYSRYPDYGAGEDSGVRRRDWRLRSAYDRPSGYEEVSGFENAGAGAGYAYQAREEPSGWAEEEDYAGRMTRESGRQMRRVQSRFQRLMRENPLAVGAAAAALGLAIGIALPETEKENEWMGEARDNMVASAQNMAKDAAEKVQNVASGAVQTLTGSNPNQEG